MFENIAALDIGTSAIKLIKIKTGFKDLQIKSISIQKLNPVAENRVEEISQALSKLLEEDPIDGYRVITNLPMELSILRTICFPFKDPEKIAEAIPFEAEENIPFGMDDLAIDFQSMKSDNPDEGKILLGASLKTHVHNYVELLNSNNIFPVKIGLEANALFECYRHYNTVEDETVIQIDIGQKKSIINIIKNKNLQFTRSLSLSTGDIFKKIAAALKISYEETEDLLKNIALDLTALENNEQRGYYKQHNLKKADLKKIYNLAISSVTSLIEEIVLTLRSYKSNYEPEDFNRILLSGGGSNINGLSTILSKELEMPVVSLYFPEEFSDQIIRSQCSMVLGTALSYIRLKNSTINLLKGEFTPDISGSSKKVYYLAGTFMILSILVLIIHLSLSIVFTSKSNSFYNDLLQKKYQRYFRDRSAPKDPVLAAKKKLNKESKELEALKTLAPQDSSVLDLLDDALAYFIKDPDFELKNLVINERVIRVDGSSTSSTKVDTFKNQLQQSKKFDSVSLNIRSSRSGSVGFTLTIKKKIESKKGKR